MGAFRNLKLRRKLLIAMIPLAAMVIMAGVYSSIESKSIDTLYSSLINREVAALRDVTEARGHTNRLGLFLYDLVVETDFERKGPIENEIDEVIADYHTVTAAAMKLSPE